MSYVVLAAGGTGGHIHAALAIGERFQTQGYKVCYFSGDRYLDYQILKDYRSVHLKASPLKGRGLKKLFNSLFDNIKAFHTAFCYFKKDRPSLAIGVGGYVGGPVLMAAFMLKIPVFILEQNGVLGLTNKLLFFIVKKIFVHFQDTKGIPTGFRKKIIVSGNPIRSDFFYTKFMKQPSEEKEKEEKLKIVVFGGSLGATSINSLVREFIKKAPPMPMHIIHQVGKDIVPLPQLTIHSDIVYEQREFLETIVSEYQWCDLVVCRSGASTISELRVVRKPCLLIPYPYHSDRQQFYNAEFLQKEVSFPVFIGTCEELSESNHRQLVAIFQEVWHDKASNKKNQEEGQRNIPLATSIIVEEMVKYVRS